MRNYYYSDGVNQFGPITIDKLSKENLSKDTLVWHDGLDHWVKAGDLEELNDLFKSVPPPLSSTNRTPPPLDKSNDSIPPSENVTPNQITKKRPPVGIISGVIILIIVILIFMNNNQSNVSSYSTSETNRVNNSNSATSNDQQESYTPPSPQQKSDAELKNELALKECEEPMRYLELSNKNIKGTFKNALSLKIDGFKLKFNIHNSATLMTFKNVRCRVTFTSNSGSVILTKNFTVNEFLKAGRTISYSGEFACTNQEFKDTDKFSVDILGADCH